MSVLIITYIHDGIVMASDSRATASPRTPDDKSTIFISDAYSSILLTPSQLGIAFAGENGIDGVPIEIFLRPFVTKHCSNVKAAPEEVANQLLKFLPKLRPSQLVRFFVAGYRNGTEQQIWYVDPVESAIGRVDANGRPGVHYSGECDVVERIASSVGVLDTDGRLLRTLPFFPVAAGAFALQDAVDFSVFLVRAQIDAVRFQQRPKTVGGPIDVLAIQPDKTCWVQRKQVHA